MRRLLKTLLIVFWVSSEVFVFPISDDRDVVGCLLEVGKYYYDKGDISSAIKYYKMALDISVPNKYEEESHSALVKIGDIYYLSGNFVLALNNYSGAYSIAIRSGNKKWIADDLLRLAKVYLLKGYSQWVEKYSLKALKVYNEIGDGDGVVEAYLTLSLGYLMDKKYDESIKTAKKVIALYKTEEQLGRAYIRIGKALFYQKRYSDAISYFKKALSVGGDDRKVSFLANLYIGRILKIKGSKDSIKYYEMALKSVPKGYDKEKYSLYREIGDFYFSQGRLEKAYSFYIKVYDKSRDKKVRDKLVRITSTLYKRYLNGYVLGKAWLYLDKMYKVYQGSSNRQSLADIMNRKAELLFLMKKPRKAYQYAILAYKLSYRIPVVRYVRYRRRWWKRVRYVYYYKGIVDSKLNVIQYFVEVKNFRAYNKELKKLLYLVRRNKNYRKYAWSVRKRIPIFNYVLALKSGNCSSILKMNPKILGVYVNSWYLESGRCLLKQKLYSKGFGFLRFVKGDLRKEALFLMVYAGYKMNDLGFVERVYPVLSKRLRRDIPLGILHDMMGILYYKRSKYSDAEKNFKNSLDIYDDFGLYPHVAISYLRLSLSAIEQKRYEESLEYLDSFSDYVLKRANVIFFNAPILRRILHLSESIGSKLSNDLKGSSFNRFVKVIEFLKKYSKKKSSENESQLMKKYNDYYNLLILYPFSDSILNGFKRILSSLKRVSRDYSQDFKKWSDKRLD